MRLLHVRPHEHYFTGAFCVRYDKDVSLTADCKCPRIRVLLFRDHHDCFNDCRRDICNLNSLNGVEARHGSVRISASPRDGNIC